MRATNDDLPDHPAKRFVVGFMVLGLATFAAFAFYCSEGIRDVKIAAALGFIAGLIGGVLSAFGKKILSCIISFAVDLFTRP